MALGKNAVFFTFVACTFLSLLIFSLSVGNNYELRQRSFVIETRVDTMDSFVSDVENDIERAAYIAGFRSLVGLEDRILSTGEYLSDVEASFNELFFNGTINGTDSSVLENNTFTDWMDKIKVEADKIGIIINFSINSLDISQDNPWEVRADINLEINVSDKENISQWTKEKSIAAYIEIEGFGDPVYCIETNGVAENRIVKSNFTYFVIGADISNLLNHTYSGYYVAFSDAPSYLMRLEGNFGSSEHGIESLVDVDELMSKGISAKNKSIVDYIYFGSQNPAFYYVDGAPGWFKVDNSSNMENNQTHLELYEVESLTS